MKIISGTFLFLAAAFGQDRGAIEAKLTSEYKLTQPTADLTDIVTAGSILVLKRGNVMMVPITASNPYANTYKDGKISQNVLGKLARFGPPGTPQPNLRTFVPGEKMWVTKIECKDDGVIMTLYTDAYAEVRYKANLKFPFDKKGAMPSAAEMSKVVGEVFKVQPADNAAPSGDQQQQQQAQAAPAPIAAPAAIPAPIAPPPPPPDQPQAPPPTLAVGQTKDEVIAMMGQPVRIAKAASKEFYFYKDVKVTFVAGKVTDIQ
jgi:outer membrane protein assembly factor BamE (lipoprotein component of BamABCDE complex)